MTIPANPTSISVGGNVEGSIVVGDHNFVVNTNNGTIVYKEAQPEVRVRTMAAKPPRAPRNFFGRQKELAQLESWIAGGKPILLYGPPGLGKTTLAKQAANGSAALSQPNGVIFLEGLDEDGTALGMGDIIQRLFDGLCESDPPLKVDLASARTYLSNLQPLVFLSSFALTAANLENLADLFPNAPILVEAAQGSSDEIFNPLALTPIEADAALQLLAEHAALSLDPTTRPDFERIAALVDDVPAALVTLGNAIRDKRLALSEVAPRLEALPAKGEDPTQAALQRAYALVLATLTDDERGMLVQTGAAPGVSIDREWLESVCGGKTVSQKLEALQMLQANSPRLRLAPGLREQALAGQDLATARDRLLQHLLEQLTTRWHDFDFVRDELGNLLGLLAWAVSQGRWADALHLGRALDPFLTLNGLWEAWDACLAAVHQSALALGDRAAEAWALHQLGVAQIGSGHPAEARRLLERARSLRQSLGDVDGMAFSQHNLDFIRAAWTAQGGSGWLGWSLGTLALVLLAAVLLFNNAFGLKPSLPIPSGTPSPTTLQPSDTPSPAPVASATPTAPPPTASATDTPADTATPVYVALLQAVTTQHDVCFYGPGRMYMTVLSWLPGVPVQVTGRNDDGSWVYLQFPSLKDPTRNSHCWFGIQDLKLAGDVSSLAPLYPDLAPLLISSNPVGYPRPQLVQAVRAGDTVTITWQADILPDNMRESPTSFRYLVEVWTCQAGKLVFTPLGENQPRAVVTDQAGCAEPSHGRVFLAEDHGYIGPSEIIWPPYPTPTP